MRSHGGRQTRFSRSFFGENENAKITLGDTKRKLFITVSQKGPYVGCLVRLMFEVSFRQGFLLTLLFGVNRCKRNERFLEMVDIILKNMTKNINIIK